MPWFTCTGTVPDIIREEPCYDEHYVSFEEGSIKSADDDADVNKGSGFLYKVSVEAAEAAEAKIKGRELIKKKASELLHPRFSDAAVHQKVSVSEVSGPMSEPEFPFGSALKWF